MKANAQRIAVLNNNDHLTISTAVFWHLMSVHHIRAEGTGYGWCLPLKWYASWLERYRDAHPHSWALENEGLFLALSDRSGWPTSNVIKANGSPVKNVEVEASICYPPRPILSSRSHEFQRNEDDDDIKKGDVEINQGPNELQEV